MKSSRAGIAVACQVLALTSALPAVIAGGCAACGESVNCEQDDQCPPRYRCDPVSALCVSADASDHGDAAFDAAFDATLDATLDAATADRVSADRASADHGDGGSHDRRTDTGPHEGPGADAAGPSDGAPGDGGPGGDTGRDDSAVADRADAARPDLYQPPVCGNGRIETGETCDDSNRDLGDGCNGDCKVEPFFTCASQPSVCHCVYFVNGALPASDGSSWLSPLASIQSAIDQAPGGCEVWVATGSYRIYKTSPADTLRLKSGAVVRGGFAGNENSAKQRDLGRVKTTLDGLSQTVAVRAYHVVTAIDVDNATFDGFVVQNGSAYDFGGGMYVQRSRLSIARCTFTRNHATSFGGGLHIENSNGSAANQVVVEDCVFEQNDAADGAGVSSYLYAITTIDRCVFQQNAATTWAGGLFSYTYANTTVVNSVFSANSSGTSGGAILNYLATLAVVNSTFAVNTTGVNAGGAIRNYAADGCRVVNSILWSNDPDEISNAAGGVYCTVDYSDVTGGYGGTANLASDPLFVAPPGDLRLLPGSPGIDTADGNQAPATDIEGRSRFDDPTVVSASIADQGAFEYWP